MGSFEVAKADIFVARVTMVDVQRHSGHVKKRSLSFPRKRESVGSGIGNGVIDSRFCGNDGVNIASHDSGMNRKI